MEEEKTICYKVNKCIEGIQKLIKTGSLDVYAFTKILIDIRKDAQRMEDALKRRKEIMVENGIEEEYQKYKAEKTKTEGINKIADMADENTKEPPAFEFTVKDRKGEIVYQRMVHGGAISAVEKIEDVDEFGAINGSSQQFFFGHDLVIWYGFNQLQHAMQAKAISILAKMRGAVLAKQFSDREKKQKLLDALEKSLL